MQIFGDGLERMQKISQLDPRTIITSKFNQGRKKWNSFKKKRDQKWVNLCQKRRNK